MSTSTLSMNKALVLLDLQPGIVGRIAEPSALLQKHKLAIQAARKAGIRIIYAGLGFRRNFPEVDPANRSFAPLLKDNTLYGGLEGPLRFHPEIAPQEEDIVVTKHRISAFSGSDLEMILRAAKVQHIVLAGISTSSVVLSTLRAAIDKDFQVTVLSDGCADGDPEIHNFLLTKLFPRHAEVITAGEWAAGLELR